MQRFAVIGLGRFGQQLATALSADGAEVIAIDSNSNVVSEIRDDVTLALRLDATDEDALRAQGIHEVDAVIVGIGHDFEAAALCLAILKGLGCKRVIARAETEMQGRILTRIGADGIVFPERESALRWAHNLLLPRLERYIELGEGHGLVYSAAPKAFHHKTLEDIQLRARFGVNLVAVKRSVDVQAPGRPAAAGGAVYTLPGPGTKILPDDVLILVGSDENLGRLPRE